jgi:chromosomal replication initiation ATPase DnaA
VQEVFSNSRTARIVAARQMIVVIARQLTPLSFPEIAKAMGRPNHSSVFTMHSRWARRVRNSAFDVSEFVTTTTGNRTPENALREAMAKIQRTAA